MYMSNDVILTGDLRVALWVLITLFAVQTATGMLWAVIEFTRDAREHREADAANQAEALPDDTEWETRA